MSGSTSARNQVFVSYSHKDLDALERLRVHLKSIARTGVVDAWDDTRIRPGERWQERIREALDSAKVAVLLLSADFLASDSIVQNELPHILAAEEEDGLVVIPVILKPCRFRKTASLAAFQPINPPEKPFSGMNETEREALWDRLTETIDDVLSGRRAKTVTRDAVGRQRLPAPREDEARDAGPHGRGGLERPGAAA